MLPRWALSGAQGCWLPLPHSRKKPVLSTCRPKHPAEPELGGAELYLLLHLGWNTFLIFLNAPLRTANSVDGPNSPSQKILRQIHRRSSAFWQPLKVIYYHPPPSQKKWYTVSWGSISVKYWYLFPGVIKLYSVMSQPHDCKILANNPKTLEKYRINNAGRKVWKIASGLWKCGFILK